MLVQALAPEEEGPAYEIILDLVPDKSPQPALGLPHSWHWATCRKPHFSPDPPSQLVGSQGGPEAFGWQRVAQGLSSAWATSWARVILPLRGQKNGHSKYKHQGTKTKSQGAPSSPPASYEPAIPTMSPATSDGMCQKAE